jgi:PIN domain nuclease of toxin-antitoxin system
VNDTNRLLLDTHVWIWLLNGNQDKLSADIINTIETASQKDAICISAISLWEVAMLASKNRIKFPIGCKRWLQQALNAPGIQLIPITPEIAVDSTMLPGDFHGDPADRLITATARQIQATLLTRDNKILRYAKSGNVNVMAC